jgi:UDP-GlcNAc:undecaprenyl-phosphate GlcNAc-1-phosphate transferase
MTSPLVPTPHPDYGQLTDAINHLESVPVPVSALNLLNSFAAIFVVAFVVTLLLTPLVRRLALHAGVTDHPDDERKLHRYPVAYLGGVAVFLGLIAAILASYSSLFSDWVTDQYRHVPLAVILGMVAITATGLADDVWGWHPRLKVAGQLVAAAGLAYFDIGVKVAGGLLQPLLVWLDPALQAHVVYWTGTALIAIFVLGGCNAANLLDGLDGLLSGVVAIVGLGLLCICVLMAVHPVPAAMTSEALTNVRVVLCLALLGAVLGFLPHNFNPATIFLGDCGSHLLGYMCVVIILMLGESGQTHLVFAGLIIFSVPIIDTTLAILRRLLAKTPMSAADDQHMHHQLARALGLKGAVFAIYGISFAFAGLGVSLAALPMLTGLRVRVIYSIALVMFSFVVVIAIKAARRQQLEAQAKAVRRPGPKAK